MPYSLTFAANLDERSSTPQHALGSPTLASEDNIYVYGQASGAVAIGTCTLNTTTFAITDAAGNHTADVAFADGEYGFVRQTAKVSP